VYKYTILEPSNNASGTMRTDIQRIKAKELKAGMTRAFSNPRFDYLIDEVSGSKYGEVKVEHGDFTATDYLNSTDVVWIVVH